MGQCRTVVGDSLCLVGTFQDLNVITVTTCTNLTRSAGTEEEVEGGAVGAHFFRVFCAKCNACVGKSYTTTPLHLAQLRGAITLDIDRLQSYPIGDATTTAATLPIAPLVEGGAPNNSRSSSRSSSSSSGGGGEEGTVGRSVEDELRAEILKVQAIILSLNERVVALEARPGSSAGEAAGERAGKRKKA